MGVWLTAFTVPLLSVSWTSLQFSRVGEATWCPCFEEKHRRRVLIKISGLCRSIRTSVCRADPCMAQVSTSLLMRETRRGWKIVMYACFVVQMLAHILVDWIETLLSNKSEMICQLRKVTMAFKSSKFHFLLLHSPYFLLFMYFFCSKILESDSDLLCRKISLLVASIMKQR